MVRTYWKGTLVAALVLPGLVWGQQTLVPVPMAPQSEPTVIMVKESGKPEQRCRVLKAWQTSEGATAREVQSLDTGEIMTIVEIGPATAGALTPAVMAPSSGIVTRIFHWGRNQMPPPGVPAAPIPEETIVAAPTPGGSCSACAPSQNGQPNGPIVVLPEAPPSQSSWSLRHLRLFSGAVVTGSSPCPCASCQSSTVVSVTPPAAKPVCLPGATVSGRLEAGQVGDQPKLASLDGQRSSSPDSSWTPHAPAMAADSAPFWKRWFQPEPTPAKPVTASSVVPAPRSQYNVTYPSLPSTVKAPVDAPQQTDWRRSWGNPDQSLTQTPAKPASSVAQAPAKPPVTDAKVTAQTPPKTPPSKPDTTTAAASKKDAAGTVKGLGMDLPHADAGKPDPLSAPDKYTRKTLDGQVKGAPAPAVAAAPAAAAGAVAAAPKKLVADDVKVTRKTPDSDASAVGKASTHPQVPLGAQSVLAAYDGQPGAVCYLPVPMVTIPAIVPHGMTQPAAPAQKSQAGDAAKAEAPPINAFSPTGGSRPDQQMVNAFGNNEATQPPMGYGPTPMMGYTPPPMMMPPMAAFAMPPMSGPIAQAGYLPPPCAAPMACYYAPSCGQPAQSAGDTQNVSQLMLTLRDSVYPSYREWAVEGLGAWVGNAQVVSALIAAAKNDPAASVRSACIHCLVKMKVSTAPAVTAIQELKSDPDPRVRSAADEALTRFGLAPAHDSVQPVLPVGNRE